MLAKYLAGSFEVASADQYTPGILFTFSSDYYSHADLRRDGGIVADQGGFVSRLKYIDRARFYGESLSCGVGTDPSKNKKFTELLKEGEWFKKTVTNPNSFKHNKETIWAVIPKGFVLKSKQQYKLWEKSSHEEFWNYLEERDN